MPRPPPTTASSASLTPQIDPGATRLLFNRSRHLGQDLDALYDAVGNFFAEIHARPRRRSGDDVFRPRRRVVLGATNFSRPSPFSGAPIKPGPPLALGTGFRRPPLAPEPPPLNCASACPARPIAPPSLDASPSWLARPSASKLPVPRSRYPTPARAGEILPLQRRHQPHESLSCAGHPATNSGSNPSSCAGSTFYRVTRAFAEARGWHTCADPVAGLGVIDWAAEVDAHFPQVAQVNRLPILPRRYYTTPPP